MTRQSGIGTGAGLAIGTVATVVVIGGGAFLAKAGLMGTGAQTAIERVLAVFIGSETQVSFSAPVPNEIGRARVGDVEATVNAPQAPSESAATELPAVSPQSAAPTGETDAFVLPAPKLDLVRIETDGSGLVAGSAFPGSVVSVLLDGVILEQIDVGQAGEFAAFLSVEPSSAPRLLTLTADYEGQSVAAEDSFILAPVAEVAADDTIALETEPTSQPSVASESVSTAALVPSTEAQQIPNATNEGSAVELSASAAPVPVASGSNAKEEAPTAGQQSAAVPQVSNDVASAQALNDETGLPPSNLVEELAQTGAGGLMAEPLAPLSGEEQIADAAQQAAPQVEAATRSLDVAEPKGNAPEADVEAGEAASAGTSVAAVSQAALDEASEDRKPATELSAPQVAVAETVGTSPETAPVVTTDQATQPTEAAPVPDTAVPEGRVDAPTKVSEAEIDGADANPAPQPNVAVNVLRVGPDGVSLVQGSAADAPEAPNKMILETISYTDTGDVLLAGRARPEALVRAYLDNAPVAEYAVNPAGQWTIEITDVVPGIYMLRLDEIDPIEGKVLSRLETPFKREAPEALVTSLEAEVEPGRASVGIKAITVQKGDTLWAISQKRYGTGFLYVRVFDANRDAIRNPDLIYPGQIFTLPE